MDGGLRKLWVVASAKTSEEPSFLSSFFFPNSMSESLQIPGSVLFGSLSRTWTWAMPVEPKGLLSRSHGGALLLDRITVREYPELYIGVQFLALHRTAPNITPEFVQQTRVSGWWMMLGLAAGEEIESLTCIYIMQYFCLLWQKKKGTKRQKVKKKKRTQPVHWMSWFHPATILSFLCQRFCMEIMSTFIQDNLGMLFCFLLFFGFFFPKNPVEEFEFRSGLNSQML